MIALLSISFLFKSYKSEKVKNVLKLFSINALGYFILVMLSLIWFTNTNYYAPHDYLTILSICIIVQTFLFYRIVSQVSPDKVIKYGFVSYITILVFSFLFYQYIAFISLTSSFLLLLLLFVHLLLTSPLAKRCASWGIIYTIASLFSISLLIVKAGDPIYYAIVSGMLMILSFYYLLKDLSEHDIEYGVQRKKKEENIILSFFRYFVVVIVLTNLIFISTVSIHEFSHASIAQLYGCDSRIILYDAQTYPHTEIFCDSPRTSMKVIMAGVLLPLIVAILLVLVKEEYMREIALLMVGFNLLLSYLDLRDLGFSSNITSSALALAIMLIVIGVILLVKAKAGKQRAYY